MIRFLRSTNGNVAMMFGIMVPVLLLSVAAAVDFTGAISAKQNLTRLADAAVLAGTRVAAKVSNEGGKDWAAAGQRAAENYWESAIADLNVDSLKFEVTFTKDGDSNGRSILGTADFSGRFASPFSAFAGDAVRVGNSVATSINLKNYIDLTFLVDVSPSMGIGATSADQNLMNPSFGNGCAFACHLPADDFQKEFETPEAARALGATLRMDVVRQAIIDALGQIHDRIDGAEVQVSVYSFATHFNEVMAPTTDLSNIATTLADLEMVSYSPTGPQQLGSTYMAAAIEDLKTVLDLRGDHGDGSTPKKRRSFVVVAGDGLENSQWFEPSTQTFPDGTPVFKTGEYVLTSRDWVTRADAHFLTPHQIMQPFDPETCETLKTDGHTVYAAQIEYITTPEMRDRPARIAEVDYIEDTTDEIRHSFETCASSSSLHVIATETDEITNLFKQIVGKVLTSDLRLTN